MPENAHQKGRLIVIIRESLRSFAHDLERATELLKMFCKVIGSGLRLKSSTLIDRFEKYRLYAKYQWFEGEAKITAPAPVGSLKDFPSFAIFWRATLLFLDRLSSTEIKKMNQECEYRGLLLRGIESELFTHLAWEKEFSPLIDQLVEQQPTREQVPQYEGGFATEELISRELNSFTQVHSTFCHLRHDNDALAELVKFYSSLGAAAVTFASELSGDEIDLEHDLERVVLPPRNVFLAQAILEFWLQRSLFHPFSDISLRVRRELSCIPIASFIGYWKMLTYIVLEMRHSSQGRRNGARALGWMFFRDVFFESQNFNTFFNLNIDPALAILGWRSLTDPAAPMQTNYLPPGLMDPLKYLSQYADEHECACININARKNILLYEGRLSLPMALNLAKDPRDISIEAWHSIAFSLRGIDFSNSQFVVQIEPDSVLEGAWTTMFHRDPENAQYQQSGRQARFDWQFNNAMATYPPLSYRPLERIMRAAAERLMRFLEPNDNDEHTFSPVHFEPYGPEINVDDIAEKLFDKPRDSDCRICLGDWKNDSINEDMIPVKVVCGHVFHMLCLKILINGIAKYSNKCPSCRRKICRARPRRPKF